MNTTNLNYDFRRKYKPFIKMTGIFIEKGDQV